jgi:hypothetical protein
MNGATVPPSKLPRATNMATLRIHGEHANPGTGQVYKYEATFEGYGPDVFFRGKIPIAKRGKVLHVERVLFVDLSTDNAVDAVHTAMRKIIDETDFATVDCD